MDVGLRFSEVGVLINTPLVHLYYVFISFPFFFFEDYVLKKKLSISAVK